jgi:hypothetical protein
MEKSLARFPGHFGQRLLMPFADAPWHLTVDQLPPKGCPRVMELTRRLRVQAGFWGTAEEQRMLSGKRLVDHPVQGKV